MKNIDISVRPLEATDYDDLYAVASNKRLWEGHPEKKRYKRIEFKKWFDSALVSGTALVIVDEHLNKIVGSTRFYIDNACPDDIAVGYTFIDCQYWGGSTNRKLKELMLDYAFQYFEVVWFHISPTNIRSQKAIQKFGAMFVKEETASFSGGLKTWQYYKIDKGRYVAKK